MNKVILSTHKDDSGRSPQAVTDRVRNCGLSNTRGPCEQDDYILARVHPLILGDELKDALISLLHP